MRNVTIIKGEQASGKTKTALEMVNGFEYSTVYPTRLASIATKRTVAKAFIIEDAIFPMHTDSIYEFLNRALSDVIIICTTSNTSLIPRKIMEKSYIVNL